MKQDGSTPTTDETPGEASTAAPQKDPPRKEKMTEEEAARTPRKEVTVKQAHAYFRKSIFTDEDLRRKTGMSRSSIDRFWSGDDRLSPKSMTWKSIAGVLEQSLVEHVRIKA